MFGEIFQFVRDICQLAWPFRIVNQWERAGYYVCGKWWREVGPGLKVVVPWFCEIREVSIAEAIVGTGRQDITIADGSLLSFAATAKVRVKDVNLAINAVDEYRETAQELLCSVLAERLASYGQDRLKPDGRGRLMTDLARWVQEEAAAYGLEFTRVRFTSFVVDLKTYRLLMEQNSFAKW